MKQLEHEHQKALFSWARLQERATPELRWLFSIPNGGHRNKATAAKLKREGVKSGVSDTMLPVARGGYHGLFIEMKAGKNKPTQNQLDFIDFVVSQKYLAIVCYDWTAARDSILAYLGMD